MARVDREPRPELEPKPRPRVGIVMGSDSDLEVMMGAVNILNEFNVPFRVDFRSAHRTRKWMSKYARKAEGRGLEVIIAGAGGAAHLPGMIASETPLPVIGVPIAVGELRGVDALLSMLQMPNGVPVSVMGIDKAENAALTAIEWLARDDKKLKAQLVEYRQSMGDTVVEKNKKLKKIGPKKYLKKMRQNKVGI